MVSSSHKLYLLLRDYASISVIFLAVFTPWALIEMENRAAALGYGAILLAQYVVVRLAAANAGTRMVTNVLALKTAAAR